MFLGGDFGLLGGTFDHIAFRKKLVNQIWNVGQLSRSSSFPRPSHRCYTVNTVGQLVYGKHDHSTPPFRRCYIVNTLVRPMLWGGDFGLLHLYFCFFDYQCYDFGLVYYFMYAS